MAVGCGWLFCFILTEADVLPSNSTDPAYRARTDINLNVVETAPWFKFPYPCKCNKLVQWLITQRLDKQFALVNWTITLFVAKGPSNMRVYLRDGSAQTILRAATLR